MSSLRSRRRLIKRPSGPSRLNRDSPLAEGLVGWWPLSLPELLNDFSGFGRTGVYDATGGSWSLSSIGWGHLGGISDVRHIDTTFDPSSLGDFTIAIWFQDRQGTTTTFKGIFTNTVSGIAIGTVNANDAVEARIVGTTLSSLSLTTGHLHHVVLKREGTTGTLIANGGQHSTSSTVSAAASVSTTMRLGGSTAGYSDFISGFVAHGVIYDYAVPDALIAKMYDPATRWDLYWRPKVIVPGWVAAPAAGRVMSSLAGSGGLAGKGGIAGAGGGLAG